MQRILHTILFILLSVTQSGFAEIYSWVDAEGNQHFGDNIPEQYRTTTQKVKIEAANIIPAVTEQPAQPKPSLKTASTRPLRNAIPFNRHSTPALSKRSSCESKKAAYNASKQCFANCRTYIKGGGINLSQCGHCKNVARPSC